jgi:hypothetical protein
MRYFHTPLIVAAFGCELAYGNGLQTEAQNQHIPHGTRRLQMFLERVSVNAGDYLDTVLVGGGQETT